MRPRARNAISSLLITNGGDTCTVVFEITKTMVERSPRDVLGDSGIFQLHARKEADAGANLLDERCSRECLERLREVSLPEVIVICSQELVRRHSSNRDRAGTAVLCDRKPVGDAFRYGPAPRDFLVHGGDAMLWTAYLNGGVVPRGETFASAVREIAGRAGVDTAPIDRPQPRDRASELLHDFFELCGIELRGNAGTVARTYLERRGFPADAIDHIGLGVVPNEVFTKNALEAVGYSELEVAQSGVLADGRWPGRLCGAWRDERGTIRTLWARAVRDTDSSTRYLYLRGRSRTDLPPFGADAPDLRVLEAKRLGGAKDPDAFVRGHGIARFRALVDESLCAVSWRARELINDVSPDSDFRDRRAGLARAGAWLGELPPRYALEQEDALRHVAERCGYSKAAVERAFRARYWRDLSREAPRKARALVRER